MNLQRTILRNLQQRHPGLLALNVLWSEVLLDEGAASYTEFTRAVAELEIKGQVVTVRGEDRIKAKITDAGIARLAEQ